MPPEWNAQLLRLSLFLGEKLTESESLWKSATGDEPQIDDNRPREGARRQAGQIGGGTLEVQSNAVRIDWLFGPPQIEGLAPPSFIIGSYEVARKAFSDAVTPWLANSSLSAHRIAFGAVALSPVQSKEDGYRRLQGHLRSVKLDPENSSDFFYQINWPRSSRVVSNLKLNRMIKLHSIILRQLPIQQPTATGQMPATFPLVEENFCRVECDHSTIAEHLDLFRHGDLVPLFRELDALAAENVEQGEIP